MTTFGPHRRLPHVRPTGRVSPRVLIVLGLACVQCGATVLLVWLTLGEWGQASARLAGVRGVTWVLVLDTALGWLAPGPLTGCILWVWSSVVALWVLAALGASALLAEVLLVLAAGPVVHLVAQRQHRRHLEVQEELQDVQEEIAARRAALAQAQQAASGLRKRLDRYGALQSVAERLNTFVAVEPMARWIVEQVFTLIGKSDVCLLFLVDPQSQALSLVASHKAPHQVYVRAKQGDVIDQWVLRSRRAALVDDVQRDFRFPLEEQRERAFRSVIAAPLMAGTKVLGVVRLDSVHPSAYAQDDLRFLDVLLELCATAMANAQLMEETQRLALTDGLTGLALRRVFLEQWERELATAQRVGGAVGLLMIDIDHFKAYNDALGHAAGDLVLQGVAQLLAAHSPPNGVVARYGGEEFIVMLPGAERAQAHAVAERIRQAVAGQPFILRRVQTHVSVSIGVAQYPVDGAHPADMLHTADTRLYQAKAQGRNRTCST